MATLQPASVPNEGTNVEESNIWSQLLTLTAKKQAVTPKHLIMLGTALNTAFTAEKPISEAPFCTIFGFKTLDETD